MSIVRYDPFRDLRTLQEEVNRLFTGSIPRTFDEEGIARGAWSPSVDIYENKEQIVLEAELPGMNREDFDLSVENNVITLRGERQFEKKDGLRCRTRSRLKARTLNIATAFSGLPCPNVKRPRPGASRSRPTAPSRKRLRPRPKVRKLHLSKHKRVV